MKSYTVRLPVTGYVDVYVEADSEEAAVGQAFETVNFRVTGEDDKTEPGEFDCHRIIARGNVCSAVINEVQVTEDDDWS